MFVFRIIKTLTLRLRSERLAKKAASRSIKHECATLRRWSERHKDQVSF